MLRLTSVFVLLVLLNPAAVHSQSDERAADQWATRWTLEPAETTYVIGTDCSGGYAWFGLRGDGMNIASGQSILLTSRAEVLRTEFYFRNTGGSNQGVHTLYWGDRVSADIRSLGGGTVYGTANTAFPFNVGEGWVSFNFEPQGIVLEPGQYLLTVYTDVPRQSAIRYCPDQDAYPDGERYSSYWGGGGSFSPYGTIDMSFRAHFRDMSPINLAGHLDILPGTCVNPFSLRLKGPNGDPHGNYGGVLKVILLGSDELDVSTVDTSNLLLEGAEPLSHDYGDWAGPADESSGCACPEQGPDGYTDLTMMFRRVDISDALGWTPKKSVVTLTLSGALEDGTLFEASDCVTIVGTSGPIITSGAAGEGTMLRGATPNPFNPATRIRFQLAAESRVDLSVFDVEGRLVKRLLAKTLPAGEHSTVWTADGFHSGVYFCRLTAGDVVEVRKLVLVK